MDTARREPSFEAADVPAARAIRAPKRRTGALHLMLLLAVAGVGGWLWLPRSDAPPTAAPPVEDRVEMPETADPASQPPAPRALLPAAGTALAADAIGPALVRFVGREAAARFLQLADFPRRAVATLDALGREHAPVAAWPVPTTPGRFAVEVTGTGQVMAAGNASRYAPFVAFVAALDAEGAVDLYRRMYPALQQAYRELGFGDRALNDRVLEVLQLLLATPEPAAPPALALVEVKGPVPSLQPWTRYEFVDADLQQLAAGQKMLLRVGSEHRATLKRQLRALQSALLRVSPVRPGPP